MYLCTSSSAAAAVVTSCLMLSIYLCFGLSFLLFPHHHSFTYILHLFSLHVRTTLKPNLLSFPFLDIYLSLLLSLKTFCSLFCQNVSLHTSISPSSFPPNLTCSVVISPLPMSESCRPTSLLASHSILHSLHVNTP